MQPFKILITGPKLYYFACEILSQYHTPVDFNEKCVYNVIFMPFNLENQNHNFEQFLEKVMVI